MKRMYKAFIYLNDDNPITMIVGGSNRQQIVSKLKDFYRKISGAAEIDIKLKEVIYINGDYHYKWNIKQEAFMNTTITII